MMNGNVEKERNEDTLCENSEPREQRMEDPPHPIITYTLASLDWVSLYSSFLSQCSTIELEYASKGRKLLDDIQVAGSGGSGAGVLASDLVFSPPLALSTQLSQLSNLVGKHESISENLSSQRLQTEALRANSTKTQDVLDLFKCEQAVQKVKLQQQQQAIDEAKGKYADIINKVEKTQSAITNPSNANKEYLNQKLRAEIKERIKCKEAFNAEVKKIKELQKTYHEEVFVPILRSLQKLDQERMRAFKQAEVVESNSVYERYYDLPEPNDGNTYAD